MEHQYMNRKIEVHTEQVGKRWDWWFVIDDRPPRHNAEGFAPTEESAITEALNVARRVIDRGNR